MYIKLIFQNAKRAMKDYLIYIITMTICVMLFYAFLSITSNYYNPNIGVEYDFTMLSDGMKLAIISIAVLLLFLIKYVNNYMLSHRKKEFAIEMVLGMEQRTVAWLFFAETFIMGAVAIVLGILFGMVCSQFITAMLLSNYGKTYELSWMLFPDTVILTVVFFSLSFLLIGLFNVHTIRKIKVIDLLYAEHYNEKSIKSSRFMPTITFIYVAMAFLMLIVGIVKKHFFFDSRFAIPVHIMFWGNIIAPMFTIIFSFIWVINRKKWKFCNLVLGLLISSIVNTCFAFCVPRMKDIYMLSIGNGTINQYLMFILVDLIFIICCIIYLASNFLEMWKEKSPVNKYTGHNLFFFGQIITKLNSTSKSMTLICLTIVLSFFLFIAAPVLVGWSEGYLKVRSLYDIQISSQYNDVDEEAQLPTGDYNLVSEFLVENGIETHYDLVYNLYLPNRRDFHSRSKYNFPIVAISLSDYNVIRQMCGYSSITLKENEFTTQWQTIATKEEQNDFLASHTKIVTDSGTLNLSKKCCYTEPLGETLYNTYTDVIYIFPDAVCKSLLPVIKNRYIQTVEAIPYNKAIMLEDCFMEQYKEEGEGVHYSIRTRTEQINSNKASNFILQASMIYGAVVLLVICLTILSLQQLMDAPHSKYRFGVLRKIGVEEQDIEKLILKQLFVWFGLPIITALVISSIVIAYFFHMISVQILAYVGFRVLFMQIGIIFFILLSLLICYFIITWTLFKKSIY